MQPFSVQNQSLLPGASAASVLSGVTLLALVVLRALIAAGRRNAVLVLHATPALLVTLGVYLGSVTTAFAQGIPAATATPVISPAAGVYSGTQTVTITDAPAGAKIYYTLNGSVPTTNSGQYSG